MSKTTGLRLGGWCRSFALLAVGTFIFPACGKNDDGVRPPTTDYGPAVPVGNGTARSYVMASAGGKPSEIGVALTETALGGLPAAPAMGTMYDLPLPGAGPVSLMPFDHISFDWNPNGHDPGPIYGLPHFDAHFYLQTLAVQRTITFDDPKGDIFPDANKLPAGYVTPPNTVPARTIPMMGRHWLDPTSPEFTPGTAFTQTLIYGTYDGHVTFVEPMLTSAILVPDVSVERALKQPAVYEVLGKYFPTTYAIHYNATSHEYLITLKDMVLR